MLVDFLPDFRDVPEYLNKRIAARDYGSLEALGNGLLNKSLWNALLRETGLKPGTDPRTISGKEVEKLAEALKIRLVWKSVLPAAFTEKQRSLFFCAAQEAIANAAKHAGAACLTVDVDESGEALRAGFANDGRPPARPVEETGGLRSLRRRLEQAGGEMRIDTEQGFRLTVTIPKGGRSDAVSGADRGGSGDAAAAL